MMKRIMAIIGFLTLSLMLTSCNTLTIQSCLPIYSMDTTIQITFYNVSDYEVHYQKIKEIYYAYDSISSDYEGNTQGNSVYDLNEKRSASVSSELAELLNTAVSLMEETGGYYNPFIGRLSRLWKKAIEEKSLLTKEEIETELKIIQNTRLTVDGNTVSLTGEGNVDLGGIAKGYATQKAKEYLDSVGVDRYLINAGNSNVVFGNKNNQDFIIALQEPYNNANIMVIQDRNKAIGTSSGKYQNMVIDSVRYHHLINPFTGYPSNIYDNVNVMCDNSTLCDVYATALFSMDLDTAKAFAEAQGIEIILFKDNAILYQSGGWKSYA